MKPQPEIELCLDDGTTFKARYDADPGEDQWFDARAGVGSPGYPPSVEITEVNFGGGWETPDAYEQINWQAYEQEIMDRLAESEAEEEAARAEALVQDLQTWKDWRG